MTPPGGKSLWNFYPRPPRGGRRRSIASGTCPGSFLSTPSARRATAELADKIGMNKSFLSTPSARRATQPAALVHADGCISIHALREEGDGQLLYP